MTIEILLPPLEAVRVTLENCETPALDVFTATNLTPAWQQAFLSKRAKDPSYTRIAALVKWLSTEHTAEFVVAIANAKTEEC